MANQDIKQENMGVSLDLDGKVDVYPAKSLPHLNTIGGEACEARLKDDVTQDLYAIICTNDYLPRTEDVNSMKMMDSDSAIRLVNAGTVFWPDRNTQYYVLIYQKPRAERYWASLDDKHPVMSEDNLSQTFVKPMVSTLVDFKITGSVHGKINPTNIFWAKGSSTHPQLGESLSAPCGVGQPIAFETIERARCSDTARGVGQHSDDCYAFGATIAMIILGKNPFQGMSNDNIINAKLNKGSFNAFVGSRSLPSAQIEILRGLLTDDANQRWSAEDIEQWVSGRRLTARSSDAGRKASRQFKFCGHDYARIKPLSFALSQNVAAAVKIIEDGSLVKWVIRSLGEEERAKDISDSVERFKTAGKAAHYQEQLVSRVCIAMDPTAPITYRGFAVMPAGIATYLAYAFRSGENLQTISEIITSKLVTFWVNMQHDAKVDFVPVAQQMERMHSVLEKTAYGEGIERVLYELNPTIPCLSPMLRNYFVIKPRYLVTVLEKVAGSGTHSSEPMDRHLAGFLIARERRSNALFAAMDPSEPTVRRGLAMLTLFGEMQYRYGPDKAPKLAAWVMPLIEPCITRFISKPFQEKVRRQASDAVKKGSISMLLKYVDDPSRVSGDEQDFLQARLMYFKVKKEMKSLEKEMKDKDLSIREVGKPVAATIACLLAIILIGITLMNAVLQSMG